MQTRYVREYFIPYRMTPDRMDEVRDQLRPLPTTQVNRDFSPIAYYFDVVLWSAQFKPDYAGWLRAAEHVRFMVVTCTVPVILLFVAVLLGFLPARKQRARAAAGYSMAATGFTLMALQILLLLAFQSIHGYVYHQLAILIALCMAGIAFGSWLGLRRIRRDEHSICRAFALIQLLLALSAPLVMLLIGLLVKFSGTEATWLIAQCVYPALAALCGILGGYQFPLATAVFLHQSHESSERQTWHALCYRSHGRLPGRSGAKRLPDSSPWILEDRVALRRGEPCTGSAGHASQTATGGVQVLGNFTVPAQRTSGYSAQPSKCRP